MFDFGAELVAKNHSGAPQIQERLDEFAARLMSLQVSFASRQRELDLSHDMLTFAHNSEQERQWIALRALALEDESIGESLEEVTALLKKHEDMERAILARESTMAHIWAPTKMEMDAQEAEQRQLSMENLRIEQAEKAVLATIAAAAAVVQAAAESDRRAQELVKRPLFPPIHGLMFCHLMLVQRALELQNVPFVNARLAREEAERTKDATIEAERLKRQMAFDEALVRGTEERRLKAEQAKALQAASLQQVHGRPPLICFACKIY